MKEYFGITVPMLYYQNHEPIEYWYDSDKNSLCAKCGVEITVNLSEDEFTKKELRKLIRQLDAAIISFYKEKGVHLLHEDDWNWQFVVSMEDLR